MRIETFGGRHANDHYTLTLVVQNTDQKYHADVVCDSKEQYLSYLSAIQKPESNMGIYRDILVALNKWRPTSILDYSTYKANLLDAKLNKIRQNASTCLDDMLIFRYHNDKEVEAKGNGFYWKADINSNDVYFLIWLTEQGLLTYDSGYTILTPLGNLYVENFLLPTSE